MSRKQQTGFSAHVAQNQRKRYELSVKLSAENPQKSDKDDERFKPLVAMRGDCQNKRSLQKWSYVLLEDGKRNGIFSLYVGKTEDYEQIAAAFRKNPKYFDKYILMSGNVKQCFAYLNVRFCQPFSRSENVEI